MFHASSSRAGGRGASKKTLSNDFLANAHQNRHSIDHHQLLCILPDRESINDQKVVISSKF
jgi:hypothetical protein